MVLLEGFGCHLNMGTFSDFVRCSLDCFNDICCNIKTHKIIDDALWNDFCSDSYYMDIFLIFSGKDLYC